MRYVISWKQPNVACERKSLKCFLQQQQLPLFATPKLYCGPPPLAPPPHNLTSKDYSDERFSRRILESSDLKFLKPAAMQGY